MVDLSGEVVAAGELGSDTGRALVHDREAGRSTPSRWEPLRWPRAARCPASPTNLRGVDDVRLFRLRPVIVKAALVTGTNHDELTEFAGPRRYRRLHREPYTPHGPFVDADSGVVGEAWSIRARAWVPLQVGDWLELDATGDLVAVRPEHAAARYQPMHG